MDLMEIWTLVTTIVTIASAVTAARGASKLHASQADKIEKTLQKKAPKKKK